MHRVTHGPVLAGILALLLAGLTAPAASAVAPVPGPQPVVGASPTLVSTEGGYNSTPDALHLANGTIRVYYAHGSQHGGPATGVVRSSTDGGVTWSAAKTVGTIRGPLVLGDGSVLAASTVAVSINGSTVRQAASTRSTNGGLSWTTDGRAAGGAGFGGESVPFGLVRLQDGSFLMAVNGRASLTDTTWHLRFLRSTDGGRTWSLRSVLRATGRSYAEPSLAVAADGTVVTAFRADNSAATDGTITVASSADGGATWGPLRGSFPHASGRPSMATLRDGSLVLMYRSTWTDFTPMRYARSIDNGTTWTYGLDFTGGSLHKMMHGAWAIGPDPSLVDVAYALETDWYHSSVLFRSLRLPTSGVEVRRMARSYSYGSLGTRVHVTGTIVSVTSTGAATPRAGVGLTFSLRSYDPADGTIVTTTQLTAASHADGTFDAWVPVPRHGELTLVVAGMNGVYRLGTYRARPGFASCPTAQTATAGTTYWLWCRASQAPSFGGEFQVWTGSAWTHQKSAWADATGLFRTPISIASAHTYRLTIWQTKWTDRVWGPSITVSVK